ncbi:hypothetical protein JB92DRAFT_2859090, partial [Gautieria morchelliformis]
MAAAHGWKGDEEDEPLPTAIPAEEFVEIGMIHPPFPPIPQLAHNFLLLLETPSTIRARLAMWQDNSHQLAAWIGMAKIHCALIPNCSWEWPPSPVDLPVSNNDQSTEQDDGDWEPNSTPEDVALVESAEPSTRVANAFHSSTEQDALKRSRDTSPFDHCRDGSDSNKKQVVLWQPTDTQLIEQREALARGEVESYHASSAASLHPRPAYNARTSHMTLATTPSVTCDPRTSSAGASGGRFVSNSKVTEFTHY